MRVLYGTTNQAKLCSMRRIAAPLGFEILGLKELGQPIPFTQETGTSPLENAIEKADAYYNAFHMPVFSCDSGLYFDGLEDSLQPGVHVRRVNGAVLTDEGMIRYYGQLAQNFGKPLIGRYRNAICFIVDDTHRFESMDIALATAPFRLISTPHPKRVEGYPLDSLSVEIKTGQYYYDRTEDAVDRSAIDIGFADFFRQCLCAL